MRLQAPSLRLDIGHFRTHGSRCARHPSPQRTECERRCAHCWPGWYESVHTFGDFWLLVGTLHSRTRSQSRFRGACRLSLDLHDRQRELQADCPRVHPAPPAIARSMEPAAITCPGRISSGQPELTYDSDIDVLRQWPRGLARRKSSTRADKTASRFGAKRDRFVGLNRGCKTLSAASTRPRLSARREKRRILEVG
jgi:hypothetical protein